MAQGPRKAMAWSIVGEIGLIVHGGGPPSAEEWQEWLAEYRRRSHELDGVFIYSFGGGPTSAQRTELLKVVNKLNHVPPTVMVTSAAFVRGIITALSWFIPAERRARVFAPPDLESAFAALDLPEPARERLFQRIAEMSDQVERPSAPLPQRARRSPMAG